MNEYIFTHYKQTNSETCKFASLTITVNLENYISTDSIWANNTKLWLLLGVLIWTFME